MDVLKLDPSMLEATAQAINMYCGMQSQAMDDYLSKMSSLQSEWDDDQTIGSLLEEIRSLRSSISTLMDQINSQYPNYFRQKAEEIRARPKF